jgi:serine/threonine protein kinase
MWGTPLPDGGSELANGRFRLLRRIGQGGMGTVYEASDSERGGAVALKVLTRREASGIRRFKREFRSLVPLIHPNLVRLHELFAETSHWYFTMELVDGVPFDRWVRVDGEVDPARLRSAFAQLVAAVGAVHAAGKLHRDLKPSNVLVRPTGEVTVLDFGLVTDWHAAGEQQTLDDSPLLGTPSHIAPEQASGCRATPASDCYALGVMLFEALTGELPFPGLITEMLSGKQRRCAPAIDAPNELGDLAQLCAALLVRDPAHRPSLSTVRQLVGDPATEPSSPPAKPSPRHRQPLLGRESELERLREAFAATRRGEPCVVFVSGESGIGKTALCESFLEEVRDRERALVFTGRCYERESVPFKMFDSLIDELSGHLHRLSPHAAAALLPRHVFALARLFPALTAVSVVAQSPIKRVSDPHELQQLAFAALHELLCRLSDRQPLVLHLDDLQWTDQDSVGFLRRLIQHRSPVPALLLASHRSEGSDRNPLLAQILESAATRPGSANVSIHLGPLSAAASSALAHRLLGETTLHPGAAAPAIAREAAGSPFLTGVLVNYAARLGYGPELASFALPRALTAELAELPDSAQRLLELLALVGQPLALATALEAAEASHTDLDTLRTARLARGSSRAGERVVECYHDRIRECASELVTTSNRQLLYASLARVLLADPQADPELVYRCLERSGENARAAHFARLAGDRAADSTAFERAAELYAKALALGIETPSERAPIELKLADALARLGRGADASAAYLRAAAALPNDASHDARLKAAESLLKCGYINEGEALFRSLCDEVGLPLPANARSALASLVWSQCKLRWRGFAFRARPAETTSADVLLRLETARAAVNGFSGNRPLLAASMADRYLLLALDSGQRDSFVPALGFQAYFQTVASLGPGSRAHGRKLIEQAAFAAEVGPPEHRAFVAMCRGFMAINYGEWTEARRVLALALEIYRGECGGQNVEWEIECARLHDQVAAFTRGDFLGLARDTPVLIDDSYSRGRLWGGAIASGLPGVWGLLAANDVSGVRAQLAYAARNWTRQPEPGWPEYFLLLGAAACEFYSGSPERAHALLQERSADFDHLLRVASARVAWFFYRGAAALAASRLAATRSARDGLVAVVQRSLTELARAHVHSSALPLRDILAAGLALARGEHERAATSLQLASVRFDAGDMRMYAAAARRRAGQSIGGPAGRVLAEDGAHALASQGVVNVDAMTDLLCPGCR